MQNNSGYKNTKGRQAEARGGRAQCRQDTGKEERMRFFTPRMAFLTAETTWFIDRVNDFAFGVWFFPARHDSRSLAEYTWDTKPIRMSKKKALDAIHLRIPVCFTVLCIHINAIRVSRPARELELVGGLDDGGHGMVQETGTA